MKILVIAPIGVYPSKSGGSTRINNLNIELSRDNSVFLFSQGIRRFELRYPLKPWTTKINKNYIEYRFADITSMGLSYVSVLGNKNIPPIFSGEILKLLNPQVLNEKIKTCDLIQIESPWQFKRVYNNNIKNKPIVLVEHNVEFQLLEQLLLDSKIPLKNKYIDICRKKEKFAIENSNLVFVTSKEDKSKIVSEFDVNKNKVYVVPNGVDISKFSPSNIDEKNILKEEMGLNNKKIILFTGWKHGPNFRAVKEILKISEKFNNERILFVVAGRIGDFFESTNNVLFTGYLKEILNYFKIADLAINPMMSGSGTNLKMLEYLASGLPTITTKIGARGFDIENGKHVIISEIEDFPKWINILLENPDLYRKLKSNGRKLVEDKYDWKQIAKEQFAIYEKLLRH